MVDLRHQKCPCADLMVFFLAALENHPIPTPWGEGGLNPLNDSNKHEDGALETDG